MKDYDIIIVGAGAAGVFASYELTKLDNNASILMLDKGMELAARKCPIHTKLTDRCMNCKPCHVMSGYGGAGMLSDGKYNITNDFGGELHSYLGSDEAMELMEYLDSVLCSFGGSDARLYSTAGSDLRTTALQHDLHLLSAKVRHLGTDRNVEMLQLIYDYTSDRVDMQFLTSVERVEKKNGSFHVYTSKGEDFSCKDLVIAAGRSGSKWISRVCRDMGIPTKSNRVDIGLRVELPAEVFKHITDEVYESKIVYKTDKYNDMVRTFCMNPYGEVVAENTNGIVTVNGHSYADPALRSENTNFALLVSNSFTEPFRNSNEYGESIARLSNMLGGGILVQRFGDLIKGRRSNERRMKKCFTRQTLRAAVPGDLALVMPKRQLDDIIEMVYALDKIAPGTANEDTLLYGVEVKFYNSLVELNERLETKIEGLYILGDGSGVTRSLSQAGASGIYVARLLAEKYS